jgi:hypothetical protein
LRRAEHWIIAAATLVVILAALPTLRIAGNPLRNDHDIPHYAAILVSAETGVSFARDPIFAGRTALVWRAAVAYMGMFKALYVLARGDFSAAILLFQIVLLVVYFPAMVLFLRSFGASLPVAIGVAAISAVSSSFLVTGTRWGILTPPVPLVMCTAVAPLIGLLGLRFLSRSSVLAATLLCVPLVLINPATGLALIELALLLALVAVVRRLLSWKLFAGLVVTAAAWTIAAQWNIKAGSARFSLADAAEMIRYGQDNVMVFPFRGATAAGAIGVALALHALLTFVFYLLRSRRFFLSALIVLQALYATFFLRAGWLALLPAAVAVDAIRRDRFEGVDRWLWCALGIAIAIGPLQQVALLAIWQRTQAAGLTALVFEGARFLQFAYLVLYVSVARAVDSMARSFNAGWLRVVVVTFICLVAWLNLDLSPFSLRVGTLAIAAIAAMWLTRDVWLQWFGGEAVTSPYRAVTALVFGAGVCAVTLLALFRLDLLSFRVPLAAGACAALVIVAFGEARRDDRAFIAACALAAFIGGPWMLLLLREPVRARSGVVHDSLGFALKLSRAERNRPPAAAPCESDFKRMTDAVRAQTPPTAVFHLMTFDRSFRPFARRAMLPVSDEWLIPIYDGAPVGRLRQESAALWSARNDPAMSKALAAGLGADYVVACESGKFAVYPLR